MKGAFFSCIWSTHSPSKKGLCTAGILLFHFGLGCLCLLVQEFNIYGSLLPFGNATVTALCVFHGISLVENHRNCFVRLLFECVLKGGVFYHHTLSDKVYILCECLCIWVHQPMSSRPTILHRAHMEFRNIRCSWRRVKCSNSWWLLHNSCV